MVIKRWKDKTYSDLLKKLDKASTEEDVKFAFLRYFEIDSSTKNRHDTYTKEILFEFKYDVNFDNIGQRAKVLAQALYYVRDLKYSEGKFSSKPVPLNLVLIDKNEVILTPTILWNEYYDDEKYNWSLSPSTPDIQLITDLSRDESVGSIHTYKVESHTDFEHLVENFIEIYAKGPMQQSLLGKEIESIDRKKITEENFEEVYHYWKEQLFTYVTPKTKLSKLFLTDIQGNTFMNTETGDVAFNFGEGKSEIIKLQSQSYAYFRNVYSKLRDPFILKNILAKIDRLSEEKDRRYEGEFYTPVEFANLGLKYLEDTLGKNWYREYKIWDMACGTGNLERSLPADCFENLYLSTLHQNEVDYLTRIFPGATCFQYDYLNDDVDVLFADNQQTFEKYTWKLPAKLREELENPNNKWVVLINPPFATSTDYGFKSKQDVSTTKVRNYMEERGLLKSSQELFCQFLYRINNEFLSKKLTLGLFSKIKYINSTGYKEFREKGFDFDFLKGFIFSSENFTGTKAKFPVGYLVWEKMKAGNVGNFDIKLDVFDNTVHNIGSKVIGTSNNTLNKWISRPSCDSLFVPFSSAITIYGTNGAKIALDKFSEGAIGYIYAGGNDFQTAPTQTAFFSGPYGNGHGISIDKNNFSECMVINSIRQIPKPTWINDRDQFMQPKSELSDEFISDCTLWSLFANSNQTSAMKDVAYKGKIYQIQNHFFPYSVSFIAQDITNPDLLLGASNRFAYDWITEHTLSPEAQAIYEVGKKVYKIFYQNYAMLNTPKWKIATWDAGWYQVRMALTEIGLADSEIKKLKELHKKLGEKILPQIYSYGFLPEEMVSESL